MSENDRIWQLLTAYFSDNIADEDRRFVEQWRNDPRNAYLFIEAKKVWESTGLKLATPSDSRQQLHALQKRIAIKDKPFVKVISFMKRNALLGAAATVIVLAVSYYILRSNEKQVTFSSGQEVATIYLPDSSLVWLNINSTLSYPEKFDRSHITLDGEAFFSVRKDSVPFVISTTYSSTKVVGTAFNLKARGDSAVHLSVVHGAVYFSPSGTSKENETVVTASETATLTHDDQIVTSKNDINKIATWRLNNNPLYNLERASPSNYLSTTFTWRKNAINQSVIEGSIVNRALLATYTKIILKAVYTRRDGRQVSVDHVIAESVAPGQTISYKKRILDVLSDTKAVSVKITSAQTTTKN